LAANGRFKIQALKDGEYRVFAITDYIRIVYTMLRPMISVLLLKILNYLKILSFVSLKLGTSIDTLKPQLYSVESVSNRVFEAYFSKDIDTFSVSSNSFIISDSAETIF
jgi:predicted transcriptional regulator of viral defense system